MKKLSENKKTISSVCLANAIKKAHRNVIRDIENLNCSADFRNKNFSESSFVSKQNKILPCVDLTKEGVTLYCLGINGHGYEDLKEAIIEATGADIAELINGIDVHDLPPDRYVYIARESESGRYKIGISKDPSARINKLNTGNPEQLTLIHHYKATESGHQSETIAHALFAEYRIRGEWFDENIDLKLLTQPTEQK